MAALDARAARTPLIRGRVARYDLVAGLVLATMLVPVGIAYALASGLPGIYGLYATIVPLLVYALFGPSRILVLGPGFGACRRHLQCRASLVRRGPPPGRAPGRHDGSRFGHRVHSVRVRAPGLCDRLLSKPIRYGYMNGIALTVLISQLPKLLGFSIESDRAAEDLLAIGARILAGKTNWVAFAIGAGTLAVILLLQRKQARTGYPRRGGGCRRSVSVLDLAGSHGVAVLGPLPQGLPGFAVPWISVDDIIPVVTGGCAVALVSFADTSVLSRAYAARTGTRVDPNQELVGLGAANLATGFFQGFPISSSSSRTPVAEAAGARTQLTGVVGAIAIALLLLFAPDLLRNLPTPALAAVVIASAIGLFEIDDLRRIYRIQRWEFWLSIACFVGVAVFGAIPGIALAIVIAVIEFLWDGWRPYSAVLGRATDIEGYHDVTRYPAGKPDCRSGLVSMGRPPVLRQCRVVPGARSRRGGGVTDPGPERGRGGCPVTSIDVTAADTLADLG